MSKWLEVKMIDVVETNLWTRFQQESNYRRRTEVDPLTGQIHLHSLTYWLDLDSPLAVECILRDIGTLKG